MITRRKFSLRRGLALGLLILLSWWALQGHNSRKEDSFAQLVRVLRPSVALVTAKVLEHSPHHDPKTQEVYGTASIIKTDAHHSLLLTAAHVVEGAQSVVIRLDDGRNFDARNISRDVEHDIALLVIDQGWLPIVALGRSEAIEAGDPVAVAGYPIPDAFEDAHLHTELSVSAGRIASIRSTVFELDIPIIPGESGGPVFDATDGTVIGIAESRFDDERAIGFATPLQNIRTFIDNATLPQ